MFDLRFTMSILRRYVFLGFIAGALLTASLPLAFAESPSVTAVLSNSEPTLGEAVQLQIRVTGSDAKPPQEINVDGLEIHPTGTSRQFEMRNFTTSSSVTYNYTILPMKAGKFRIPPQTLLAGGTTLRTQELTLTVSDSGAGGVTRQNPNAGQPSAAEPRNVGFIELILPKQTAYVGEVIPVVVKVCLNPRGRFRQLEPPVLNAQGLTMQRLEKSGEGIETIKGATYQVITYKTAMAAAKTGRFELPAVESKALVMMPRQRSGSNRTQRQRSPFDIFNMDPFNDPLFGDLTFVEPQQITLRSEPTALEVKPLPPNAPPHFSGAVGTFTMNTDAKPRNVQVDDPVTVTSTITGRGNFDRVSAPAMEDDKGWHKYPPSAKFEKDDDVGISGTKTFEMAISPTEKKTDLPPLFFAFFDPTKEQYQTLRSEPIPVQVEGAAAPAAAPAASAATSAPPVPAEAKPAEKPQDILYQVSDFGRAGSFTPLYKRSAFRMAQLIPLLVLVAFAGWKIRQAKSENREARRKASLQHEEVELMRKLRRGDSSPEEYFSRASRAVQIKTALASRDRGIDPNAVDEEVAEKTFALDDSERAQLRRLFARADELRYSGAHNGAETITRQDREAILQLIENLRA